MYEELAAEFAGSGLAGEVQPFITDMPAAFAQADLIVCRSGAGAVSELAAAGKPSMLVPFPFAADDHQLKNARGVRASRSGGVCRSTREWTGQKVLRTVREVLYQDRGRLRAMGENARKLAHPGRCAAAAQILFERKQLTLVTAAETISRSQCFFHRQHLHFAGIGGIGMSGIAEVLLNLGYTISGSDLKLSPTTDRLAQLGATIYEGHDAANVAGAKALVVSSAVDESNPEVQEARRLQIPVIPRGELLAELMRLKYGIAVAGSHGKTTTTSMIATILSHAGMDPTVVVGGKVAAMGGSNARVGKSEFLVVESDESDGSFLKLSPILAIVTNIDREHLDHYADIEAIRAAFTEFVNKVPFYGAAILCLDSENVQTHPAATCAGGPSLTAARAQAEYRTDGPEVRRLQQPLSAAASRAEDLGEFQSEHPRRAQRSERDGGDRGRAGTATLSRMSSAKV